MADSWDERPSVHLRSAGLAGRRSSVLLMHRSFLEKTGVNGTKPLTYLTDRSWASTIASGDGRGRFVLTPRREPCLVRGPFACYLLASLTSSCAVTWQGVDICAPTSARWSAHQKHCGADGDTTIRGGHDARAIPPTRSIFSASSRAVNAAAADPELPGHFGRVHALG